MIVLHELGYRIAEDQQSLTPLQRKVLLYGYVHFVKSIQERITAGLSQQPQKRERDLAELAHILPKASKEEGKE